MDASIADLAESQDTHSFAEGTDGASSMKAGAWAIGTEPPREGARSGQRPETDGGKVGRGLQPDREQRALG